VDTARSGETTSVEGLTEPLAARTRALLRRAVRDHAAMMARDRRRSCPPVLHVGVPGERVATVDVGLGVAADGIGPIDPGLRTDMVAALRVRAGRRADELVWLARSGGLELQDVDAEWLAATRAAYAEAEAPLAFVVVNRHGWRDPRSGLGRTWVRVRPCPNTS
jgi:hypothetical protein